MPLAICIEQPMGYAANRIAEPARRAQTCLVSTYQQAWRATGHRSRPCHCAILEGTGLRSKQSVTKMIYRKLASVLLAICFSLLGQVDVLTANYDNNRTNANLGES